MHIQIKSIFKTISRNSGLADHLSNSAMNIFLFKFSDLYKAETKDLNQKRKSLEKVSWQVNQGADASILALNTAFFHYWRFKECHYVQLLVLL